jgi:Fe-S-cluster-containing dehydrogenase component
MFKRADGIVDFDKSICIGCKACMAACPYDAIFINPDDHSAEKCNFCAHRIDMQLEPRVRRCLSRRRQFSSAT